METMKQAKKNIINITKNKVQPKLKLKVADKKFKIVLSTNNLREMIDLIQETRKSYDGQKTFVFSLHQKSQDKELVHLDYQVLFEQLKEARKR